MSYKVKREDYAGREAKRLVGLIRTGDRDGMAIEISKISCDDLIRIEKSASKIRKRRGPQADAVYIFIEKLRQERLGRKFENAGDMSFQQKGYVSFKSQAPPATPFLQYPSEA